MNAPKIFLDWEKPRGSTEYSQSRVVFFGATIDGRASDLGRVARPVSSSGSSKRAARATKQQQRGDERADKFHVPRVDAFFHSRFFRDFARLLSLSVVCLLLPSSAPHHQHQVPQAISIPPVPFRRSRSPGTLALWFEEVVVRPTCNPSSSGSRSRGREGYSRVLLLFSLVCVFTRTLANASRSILGSRARGPPPLPRGHCSHRLRLHHHHHHHHHRP